MEFKKVKVRGTREALSKLTLEKFVSMYPTMPIRAYDSEQQNKSVKITKANKTKYIYVSAYYHDNFIAVYVRKSPKKGKRSK